jgi:hypothetical protein
LAVDWWDKAAKKKAGCYTGPALEAVGDIVIWEGNYRSDVFNIGILLFFL